MSVPPGSSYPASNAYIKLKRQLLNLEAPVRIQFKDEWTVGNPLHDWYHRRVSHLISTIQFRKEEKAPFFHEYIVFELQNNGGYYRMDRRQLPDETVPLDSIYENGVEPFDTIEQVTSLADETYSTSHCLAECRNPVQLELVLGTLWAIHQNSRSRVYTLQRYNCYFFAQTVFLSSVRSITYFLHRRSKKHDAGLSDTEWRLAYPSAAPTNVSMRLKPSDMEFYYNPDAEISKCRAGTLPSTLRYMFRALGRYFFYDSCPSHFDSCPSCLGSRPTVLLPNMALNASGRISSQLIRRWDSTFFYSFQMPVVQFWQQILSRVLKLMILAVDRNRDKILLLVEYASAGENKPKHNALKAFDQIIRLHSRAIKSAWSKCFREALLKFTNDFGPAMIQRTLECPDPIRKFPVISAISAANVTGSKRMQVWMEHLTSFLNLEYGQLERALKTEAIACWARNHASKQLSYTMSVEKRARTILKEPITMPIAGACTAWVQWRQSQRSNISVTYKITRGTSLHQLEEYLRELITIHGTRVEQYKRLLKCTRDEVCNDIDETRRAIWSAVESGWEQTVWGLQIDPTKFSLPMIREPESDSSPSTMFGHHLYSTEDLRNAWSPRSVGEDALVQELRTQSVIFN